METTCPKKYVEKLFQFAQLMKMLDLICNIFILDRALEFLQKEYVETFWKCVAIVFVNVLEFREKKIRW